MSEELIQKLANEARRIEEDAMFSSKGHYNSGESWKRLHYYIGIPTAILAAVASASAFNDEGLVAGVIGILVAVLTSLSTFLDPSGKKNEHYAAGAAFGSLKNQARMFHEIEILRNIELSELNESLMLLANKRDDLNSTSPLISRKSYIKAKSDIEGGTNTYSVDKG